MLTCAALVGVYCHADPAVRHLELLSVNALARHPQHLLWPAAGHNHTFHLPGAPAGRRAGKCGQADEWVNRRLGK
jgi:hypothetical protein